MKSAKMSLQELRKAAGMSQRRLAELSGVNNVQIARIETGVISIENISLKNAIKLADALGVEDVRKLIEKE